MSTFGKHTLIAEVILVTCLLVAMVYIQGNSTAIAFPFAIALVQLLNTPVIRVSKDTFSVFTPSPFSKKIKVAIADVEKITVDAGYIMRFIVHMKDGSIKSTIASVYTVDLKPLHEALVETGVTIEGTGNGTVDWAENSI